MERTQKAPFVKTELVHVSGICGHCSEPIGKDRVEITLNDGAKRYFCPDTEPCFDDWLKTLRDG